MDKELYGHGGDCGSGGATGGFVAFNRMTKDTTNKQEMRVVR